MAVNKLHGAEINGVVGRVRRAAHRARACHDARATSRRYRVATIPGDGVGPEVVAAARRVVDAAGAPVRLRGRLVRDPRRRRRDRRLRRRHPAPRTSTACGEADAILLGAVGGPKWSDPSAHGPPGAGAVRAARRARAVRQPAAGHASIRRSSASSPLRPELLDGVDMLIVRELTGGVYFGDRAGGRRASRRARSALDTLPYAEHEIARIVRLAFELAADAGAAASRQVDKANVLATSRLWRTVADEIARRATRTSSSATSSSIRARCCSSGGRPTSTSSSPRTCSATSCRTRRRSWPASLGMLPSASLGERRTDARHVRPVRADPRLGAGHRRPGHGQPDRHDPVGGDAAADRRSGATTRPTAIEAAVARGPRRRLADGRPGRCRAIATDGLVVVGTTAFATAVVEALEAGGGRGGMSAVDAATPRSSCTTRPCATAPRARTSRCRSPTSCASRGCSTSTACPSSRAAGRAPTPRTSSSSRPPGRCAGRRAKLAAFGSTRHRSNTPERRPEPARAGRGRDAGRDDLRQELAAPRHRGPGRHAGREPRHDRGLGRLRRRSRARGGLRRRALLRRLQGRPRLRARDAARRPPGRRPDARPVRHQRRHADRRAGRRSSATSAATLEADADAPGRDLGHPHPQRRRARGRQLDGGRRRRDPPRPGDDQRLRRARRQREHGQHPGQPRAQDAARARPGRRRRPRRA